MSDNKRIFIASVVIALILAVFNYSFLVNMLQPAITTIIVGTLFTIVVLFMMFKVFVKIL